MLERIRRSEGINRFSELEYFEPNLMQLSVMGEYAPVFGTGETFVLGGPNGFFVRGSD